MQTGSPGLHEASAKIRVALFRDAEAARSSAARLAAMRLDAVIAPVIAPAALDPAAPRGRFDALVATSARALTFVRPEWIAPFAQIPLYVVGAAGEAAAATRGLAIAATAADAVELAGFVTAALRTGESVLYLAGADRKPHLEDALIRNGISVVVAEVYAARARPEWSAEEALEVATCRAALHYSRRSAELAGNLAARAGIWTQWRAMKHVAISADAAEPFRGSGVEVTIATAPREESMLRELVS